MCARCRQEAAQACDIAVRASGSTAFTPSAVVPHKFDEYCWFDRTSAAPRLDAERLNGMPETYPFGV